MYERREPTKDGKLYFVFCEGEKREITYFHFFNRIASQIIIQIVPASCVLIIHDDTVPPSKS